jgi:hypothetical protein
MKRCGACSKKELKPWLKQKCCIPIVSPEFVYRMEDVLDLYAEAYQAKYPVVCFDQSPYQLISETACHCLPSRANRNATIPSTNARPVAICSCSSSHCGAGGTSR